MILDMRRAVGVYCLLQAILVGHAIAGEDSLHDKRSLNKTYFRPYPGDGAPIVEGPCGHGNDRRGWTQRDLGGGVNVEVGISDEKAKQITATLLIRFHSGELEISPEDIRLYVFPNEKIYKPSGVRRAIYRPNNERCAQYGEWLYLIFPVQRKDVEQVALVFTGDTVIRGRRTGMSIRPFRFARAGASDTGSPASAMPPINIRVVSAEERLKSCESTVAIAAAEEIVAKRSTLREPLRLFPAALALFLHDRKDEAVFWFYAAQLRTRYQLVFERDDRGQLLAVMMTTTGTLINSYAFQNVANLSRIMDRVLEWDRNTWNPFRERAITEADNEKIEQIYSGFRALQERLVAEKDDLEHKARMTARHLQRMSADRAKHCRPSAQQGAPRSAPRASRP